MDGNAGKTGKIVRLVCAVLLVLAALSFALILAAESACDLGIAGGLSRLFAGERRPLLAAFLRRLWIPAAALALGLLFVLLPGKKSAPDEGEGGSGAGRNLTALFTAAAVVCAAIAVLLTAVRYAQCAGGERAILSVRQAVHEDGFILHAGGALPGNDGEEVHVTNSVQSLENYRKNGKTRFLEMDLLETSDGDIICAHDWEKISVNGKALEGPVTKAEAKKGFFKDTKYTPASMEDLIALIDEKPETMIVSDVKDDNTACMRLIAERWPSYRDHFIVQIYHASEYDEIRELGYPYILFTIYRTKAEEHSYQALRDISASRNLVSFTIPAKWTIPDKKPSFAGEFDLIRTLRTQMYCHTVDKPERMKECLDMGFDAIYTNVVGAEKPGV